MTKPLRFLSICTGIGGIDLAAEWAGMKVVGQVEIDLFCLDVLARHWPKVKRLHDVREVVGDEFGRIDVMAGGIPCQPWSAAGKQRGARDDRHLWPAMRRIIDVAQPTWVLVENVAGFARMALDDVCADLDARGYEVGACLLPAASVGAPHLRERVFVVAYAASIGRGAGRNTQQRALEARGRDRRQGHSQRRASTSRDVERTSDVADARRGEWQTESRMGREPDGLPRRMDGGGCPRHPWPVGPNEVQPASEAPRTVTGSVPHRASRLKALGNAVVPQQVYPILTAIAQIDANVKPI